MQALEAVRSPLTVCVEHLQQTAGPAAMSENAVALATKLMTDRSTLQACSQIILQDFGLTLRLLRIANSAMFNPAGKTVTSVTHASALLGTDALAQIVDTVPRFKLAHPARELVALSHIAGVMARNLMARTEPRYSEEAFICGLFRNIGEICFALDSPDEYQKILGGSHRNLIGLRASCQMHSHFDFDELSAGLLHHWAFYGPPVLSAQSTPDALYAQHGNPEADIALVASLAHTIVTAHFRAEPGEREKLMRHSWGALVKLYNMREAQVESLSAACLEAVEPLLKRMDLHKENFKLKDWVPEEEVEKLSKTPVVTSTTGVTMAEVLRGALHKGVDRAAWLPYADPDVKLGVAVGNNWPSEGAGVLPTLIHHRKPPYLLAFAQRQDVWIDFGKDNRFREAPLAVTMQPAAYFLLPVCDGRKVRGCLYFDWVTRREFSPETLMPILSSVRDYVTTNFAAL